MHPNLSPLVAAATVNQPPLSLLAVDDSAFDRARLRRLCHAAGLRFRWHEASGAAEMMELLAEHAVDVILLDYFLPDIDGLACAAQLRSGREDHAIGIVLVSGRADDELGARASLAGCDVYLEKSGLKPDDVRKGVLRAHFVQTMRVTLSTLTGRRGRYLM